jgi:hypothetical protein
MRKLLIGMALLSTAPIFGQEFLGFKAGNYSGSTGMLMNPSSLLSGNLAWDVNLLSAGVFAQNNYIYAPEESAIGLLGGSDSVAFFPTDRVNAHANILVQGPSAFYTNGAVSIGFFTTARSAGFVHSEDFPEGVNVLENIQQGVPVQVAAFDASILNWIEVGVNGGMALSKNLHVGANLKYLGGYDAATIHNREGFTFTRGDRETEATNLLLDYSYSSNFGSDRATTLSNSEINGWGLGTDIGFTWVQYAKGPEGRDGAFQWKAGASILDLGVIRFKQNSATYHLAANDLFSVSNPVVDSIDDLDELTLQGSQVLYDNVLAAQIDNKFPVFTPAALSVQGSVNLGNDFFVHGMVVQNMAIANEQMVARPNLVAVIPQYDTRMLTVSLPVSVYDYEETHVGLSVRFMYFTVGTDNLTSLVVPGDLDGADIYAGIRIIPSQFSEIGSGNGGNKMNRSRSKQLDCPSVF